MQRVVEQRAQPAEASTPATSPLPASPAVEAQPGAEQVAGGGRCRCRGSSSAPTRRVDLHPLAPQPHQVRLAAAGLRAARSLAVSLCSPSAASQLKATMASMPTPRRPTRRSTASRRPGPQPEAGAAGPPRREEQGDAGVVEGAGILTQQPDDPARVQLQLRRPGLVEQRLQLRRHPHRVTETGEQLLDGFALATVEERQLVALPDDRCRDDQARIVDGLQEQLHSPGVVGVLGVGGVGGGVGGLVDPEAEPRRACGGQTGAHPSLDLGGQRGHVVGRDGFGQPGVFTGERVEPRVGRGPPDPPWGNELHTGLDQATPSLRVDDLLERLRHLLLPVAAVPALCREQAADHGPVVGRRQRPPPRPRPPALPHGQPGHDPARGHEPLGHRPALLAEVGVHLRGDRARAGREGRQPTPRARPGCP